MKKLTALAALFCTLSLISCSADKPKAAAPTAPMTDEQETVYAIGVLLSESLKSFELTPEEVALVQKGIADGLGTTKPAVSGEEYMPKVQALQQTRMAKVNTDFLAKAATEVGATKTASGIIIKHTKVGTGASPAATDQVKVHYEGRLITGKVFDSSIARGEPVTFPLDGVIPCWTEGVQTMKVGGKAQLICPANLAYGDRPPPSIPPGSTLVFDVELLDIAKAPKAPK